MFGKKFQLGRFMKKGLATFMMLSALSIAVPTTEATPNYSTVYRVYMDKQYIGTVAQKEAVKQAVARVTGAAEQEAPGYHFQLENRFSYVPKQILPEEGNIDQIDKKIETHASVKAVATAITFGEETPVYLKNADEAKAVLDKVVQQYVSKAELADWRAQHEMNEAPGELEKDESRITNIQFKEPVELKEILVEKDQILTVDEAARLLRNGTLTEEKHKVKKGDILSRIAEAHNMSSEQLLQLNEGIAGDSHLRIGEELTVTIPKPFVHAEVEREIKLEESVPFETEIEEDPAMPIGETKVKQAGKDGRALFTYKVIETNGQETDKAVIEKEVIEKPVKEIIIEGTKVIPDVGTGEFVWPASGGVITSKLGPRWGVYHKGIDIARPRDFTIKAADHGVVIEARKSPSYGNKIVIDHQNGYKTLYAHLEQMNVSIGQKVEKGSEIGIMGSTGHSTGIHLHFELYKNGQLKDPLQYTSPN